MRSYLRFARNRRLYDHLFAMSLVVDPVLIGGDPSKIDHLIVAVAPPTLNVEVSPALGVAQPVEGSEVAEGVAPVVPLASNVVDFPSVLGLPVSIHREPHDPPE